MTTIALHDDLQRTVKRWPAATAANVDQFVRSRVNQAAAVQSGRILATANAELANRALTRFIELLYDGAGGTLYNVAVDGRIKIAAPWSRTRYADYGLSDHGARVLRSVITWRLAQLPSKHQLLWCNGSRWFLNLARFPDLAAAGAWLGQFPVTPELWHSHNETLPRRRRGDR